MGQKREIFQIKKIIIHCSDSDNPKHDQINVIRQWHKLAGWHDVGYHYFVRKNGEIQMGRPIYLKGAHTLHHNDDSIGICLSGRKAFTENQFKATAILIYDLFEVLGFGANPLWYEYVFPHNVFDKNKTCPNFDIKELFKYTNPELIDFREAIA